MHQVELLKCKIQKMLQSFSTNKKCSRVLANFFGLEILEHPPYSLDIAPIFLEMKGKLSGMRFVDATELCICTQNFVSSYTSDWFSDI